MDKTRRSLAALALAAGIVFAAVGPAQAWRVGNWAGAPYRSPSTGGLVHCQMAGRYKSGIALWFRQYASYNLYVGMSKPGWRLVPNGNYSMIFIIDGRIIRSARGIVLREDRTRIWLPLGTDRYTRRRLQRGFRLVLVNNRARFTFNLPGTGAALARLEGCVRRGY